MDTITDNELKTRGIQGVERLVKKSGEAAVTVRGKIRYIIVTLGKYGQLREAELEYAVQEAQDDIAHGRIAAKDIDEHLRQVKPCRIP
jgi:hypothetical protein